MYTPYLYPAGEDGFTLGEHWRVGEGGVPMAIPLGYVLVATQGSWWGRTTPRRGETGV